MKKLKIKKVYSNKLKKFSMILILKMIPDKNILPMLLKKSNHKNQRLQKFNQKKKLEIY